MKAIRVKVSEAGLRLDFVLSRYLHDQSRAYWQKAINAGYITVNDGVASKDYRVTVGDKVKIFMQNVPVPNCELPIIYEDDSVIVFNKPTGMLTHSKGAFNPEFTVGEYMKRFFPHDKTDRPGIVHRLDRSTSGVIIAAKNEKAKVFLQRQFSSRQVQKIYIAAVKGSPKPSEAVLDWPIERNPKKPQTFRVGPSGKSAQTYYQTVCAGTKQSLVRLEPRTGRTHQLRVHLSYLGHSIIGDALYSRDKKTSKRLMLHASSLTLKLPTTHDEQTFQAELPPVFEEVCRV